MAAPDGPAASFASATSGAQLAAGLIAARRRGDLADAEHLLASFDDQRHQAAGCLLLADLALALLAEAEGRDVTDVAGELSLQLASLSPATGD